MWLQLKSDQAVNYELGWISQGCYGLLFAWTLINTVAWQIIYQLSSYEYLLKTCYLNIVWIRVCGLLVGDSVELIIYHTVLYIQLTLC